MCRHTAASAGGKPLCGTPEPTTLTLTVNGSSCTADTTRPSNYRPGNCGPPLSVPNGTTLTVTGKADEPMPKGWTLEVHHNGDPHSTNGNYYLVCSTTTTDSCSATGQPTPDASGGDIQDIVYAQINAPTGLYRLVQIEVDVKKSG
jgi:hypothetical protein